jgi:hypothetical protein
MAMGSLIVQAAEPTGPDPDLPQQLDIAAMQMALQHSPFTRVVDYAGTLQLTGVASVNGKPLATLMDKATKQRYVVSEEPNAKGWRLAEVSNPSDIKQAQVKLVIGEEVVTLQYTPPVATPGMAAGAATATRFPTEQEFLGRDENGKAFVKGSVYLSEADRERYHNGLSREAHDKFREIIRGNRERMFAWPPEVRAKFAKSIFDTVDHEDRARQGK